MPPITARRQGHLLSKVTPWGGRALFAVSLLAILGTSKPKGWELKATVTGPRTASSGRALEVTIDASDAPTLVAEGAHLRLRGGGPAPTPCLARWHAGTKLSCLLPPAATLAEVETTGSCGGGCENKCPPPSGAFVAAASAPVDVWKDIATRTIAATLPAHGVNWVATPYLVKVGGARFVTAKLTVTPRGGGRVLFVDEQPCKLDASGSGSSAVCFFLVDDGPMLPTTDVDVTAEATGWGTDCAGLASTPCPAPGTLRVDAIELAP